MLLLEIIVTSHNPHYEFEGAKRHEPQNNKLEIDRFTAELIEDDMCFLYGDTYYTEAALKEIFTSRITETTFFGNEKSIVAIRVTNADEFRTHKTNVRQLFIGGKIKTCKGWQVYQSFAGQDLSSPPQIREQFVIIHDDTRDINTAKDYEKLSKL